MQTKVLIPDAGAYQLASDLLNRGELVAFPTETVYGLGANALNREAVLSIFAAKGRPADNPLIVHIHDRSQLDGKGTSRNHAKGTDKGTFDRDAHMYGNIGVTTSAQMLEGELEVRKNNLYNMIADCFATELCILVY